MQYRQECKLKLGLDANYAKNLAQFNLLTNSQFHDLQCLERCVLIKRGIINENETLQEDKVKEHFPNINITKDFSKTCPIIANVTEKCERGYLIGKCLQFQAPNPWKNHKVSIIRLLNQVFTYPIVVWDFFRRITGRG